MKLTVLADNNSLIDTYLIAEPAVSYLLEVDGQKVLFDCGYSEVFLQNALKLGEDLLDIDFIVFSHGHDDHVGGLTFLLQYYDDHPPIKRPQIVCHPHAFYPKRVGELNIGIELSSTEIGRHCDVHFSDAPLWLTESLVFLGEIKRENSFEKQTAIGCRENDGKVEPDLLFDDSALAYRSQDGIVVITGCSHAGICNIISYAQTICKEKHIMDVIGGFHLLTPPQEQVDGMLKYFTEQHISHVHPCHCTNLTHKILLSQNHEIGEVGVGLSLEY